jgi:hypothetical protein
MPFVNVVDRALLDSFLADYTTLWAGYSTTTPAKAGTGATEPTDAAYARVDISANLTRTDSTIDNDAEITFPEATASQGTVTYALIYDAETVGDLLWYGQLTASKAVDSGDTPRFPAGDFDITAA